MVWHVLWAEITSAEAQPLWLRLPPEARFRVLLALVTIVILGLLLVLFIRSFGRWVRHYAGDSGKGPLPRETTPREDDWADRPLNRGDADDAV
jgi:phosphotransferase system  glucose/maltose/N-acetylglucosamine-specific IIC component